MNLWATTRRHVDDPPGSVDDQGPAAGTGRCAVDDGTTRWMETCGATSVNRVSSTIHTPYYHPCKNYIPL